MARLRIDQIVRQIDSLVYGDLERAVTLFRQLWRWTAADTGGDAQSVAASISTRFPRNKDNFRTRLVTILTTTLSDKAQRHVNGIKKELPWGMDILDFACVFVHVYKSDRALHALRVLAKHEDDFEEVMRRIEAQAQMRRARPRKNGQNHKTHMALMALPDLYQTLEELCARAGDPAQCELCTGPRGEWQHGTKKKGKKQSVTSPQQTSDEDTNAVPETRENLSSTDSGAGQRRDGHCAGVRADEASAVHGGRSPEKGRSRVDKQLDDNLSCLQDEGMDDPGVNNDDTLQYDQEQQVGGVDQGTGVPEDVLQDESGSSQVDVDALQTPARNSGDWPTNPGVEVEDDAPPHFDYDFPESDVNTSVASPSRRVETHQQHNSVITLQHQETPTQNQTLPVADMPATSQAGQKKRRRTDRREPFGRSLPSLPTIFSTFHPIASETKTARHGAFPPKLSLVSANGDVVCVAIEVDKKSDIVDENWALAIVDYNLSAITIVAEDTPIGTRAEAMVKERLPQWAGHTEEVVPEWTTTKELFSDLFGTAHIQSSCSLVGVLALVAAFDVRRPDVRFLADLWAEILAIYQSFLAASASAPADDGELRPASLRDVLDTMNPTPEIGEDLDLQSLSLAGAAVARTDSDLQHSRRHYELLVASTGNIKIFTRMLKAALKAAAGPAHSDAELDSLRKRAGNCRALLGPGCSEEASLFLRGELQKVEQQLSDGESKLKALTMLETHLGSWRIQEVHLEDELKDVVKENTEKARAALGAALRHLDHI